MNKDFQNMLDELKKEYLADLPKKIEQLENLMLDANLEIIEDEFHKLKGTGKTYGVPEVTDICAIAEESCLQKASNWQEVSNNAISELKAVLLKYN
ncbi:MAG: Hpt domain-containing protein [Bdellovibrionaceae bacterium]|nr:Hpt domain-containing protein [Pseudobdellovibrionaceae bacterium]